MPSFVKILKYDNTLLSHLHWHFNRSPSFCLGLDKKYTLMQALLSKLYFCCLNILICSTMFTKYLNRPISSDRQWIWNFMYKVMHYGVIIVCIAFIKKRHNSQLWFKVLPLDITYLQFECHIRWHIDLCVWVIIRLCMEWCVIIIV